MLLLSWCCRLSFQGNGHIELRGISSCREIAVDVVDVVEEMEEKRW